VATALSIRQQRLAENARLALERGQYDYVLEVAEEIMRVAPGCLAVRRLQRSAQLRRWGRRGRWLRIMRSRLGLVPLLWGNPGTPAYRRAAADRLLELDPTNVGALRVLAEAALALAWPETAVFAREAVRELCPGDQANLIALGQAWLEAGRPEAALRLAEEVLRSQPADGPALELLRHASVAHTVAQGNWDSAGTFREKLRGLR
jgi:tetratricopeptide (TPR) repeat protein